MPLENLTGSNVFITNLVPSNPAGTDPVSEGDNHIAGTKNVLVNSFPAINGAVTATPTQLNQLSPAGGAAFTGVPTAPTAAPGTSTTQLATTAFVTLATDAVADAIANSSLGVNQTWQAVTGTRAVNTDYTNDTGAPIQVSINVSGGSGDNDGLTLLVGGVPVVVYTQLALTDSFNMQAIVPNGTVYRLNDTGAGVMDTWLELR